MEYLQTATALLGLGILMLGLRSAKFYLRRMAR